MFLALYESKRYIFGGVFPLVVPSGPPFATIEASSNTVRGGDIFNVTCTVLGEPEMNVSFGWRYPGLVSVTFVID